MLATSTWQDARFIVPGRRETAMNIIIILNISLVYRILSEPMKSEDVKQFYHFIESHAIWVNSFYQTKEKVGV